MTIIKCNCRISAKNIQTETTPEDGSGLVWDDDAYGGVGGWIASEGQIITTTTPVQNKNQRITDGLLALYTFKEGAGATVADVSGVGTPLDLTIADPTATEWLSGGGLAVNSETIIESAGTAEKLANAVQASNELTLEAWVKPANTTQEGPARIVTISGGSTERDITMGQGLWLGDPSTRIDVRCRTTTTGLGGTPSTTTPPGTLSANLHHVVFTRGADGIHKIYIDGIQQAEEDIGGDLSNWSGLYPLALANEVGASRPWLGEFYLVAFYDRALTPEEIEQNYELGFSGTADNAALVWDDAAYGGVGGWVGRGVVLNSETSETPGAGLVPRAGDDGKLDTDWLDLGADGDIVYRDTNEVWAPGQVANMTDSNPFKIGASPLAVSGEYFEIENAGANGTRVVLTGDVTLPQDGYTEAETNNLLAGKSDTGHDHDGRYLQSLPSHNHDDRYYTEAETNNLLASKSAINHHHNDSYYTEYEMDNLLSGKAPLYHTHDGRYFTEAECEARYTKKSDFGAWQTAILSSGWTHWQFAPLEYRKEPGGLVRLRGLVSTNSYPQHPCAVWYPPSDYKTWDVYAFWNMVASVNHNEMAITGGLDWDYFTGAVWVSGPQVGDSVTLRFDGLVYSM